MIIMLSSVMFENLCLCADTDRDQEARRRRYSSGR